MFCFCLFTKFLFHFLSFSRSLSVPELRGDDNYALPVFVQHSPMRLTTVLLKRSANQRGESVKIYIFSTNQRGGLEGNYNRLPTTVAELRGG